MLLDAKNTCVLEMKQAKKFAYKVSNIDKINQKIKEFEEEEFRKVAYPHILKKNEEASKQFNVKEMDQLFHTIKSKLSENSDAPYHLNLL